MLNFRIKIGIGRGANNTSHSQNHAWNGFHLQKASADRLETPGCPATTLSFCIRPFSDLYLLLTTLALGVSILPPFCPTFPSQR